jgi:signal transduction histidine kinase/tetratricopeptide (TPR) repeat protein
MCGAIEELEMRRPMRATKRLLAIFIITILAPGLILGFFGLRAFRQEKRLAEQQIRERLAVAAESMGRLLDLELRSWQQAAGELARAGPANRDTWPERLRRTLAEPGAAVVLFRNGDRVESLPAGQLLYALSEDPDPSSTTNALSPLIVRAEALEWREKKYNEAIAIYRRLLESSISGQRAAILHRLARNLKKAGQVEEALHTFRLLEKEPRTQLESLPSDLVALYEMTSLETGPTRSSGALRFYQDLVRGRWRLQKSSYIFYSEQAREWLTGVDTAHLIEEEQWKLELSLFAEQFMDAPRSFATDEGTFLAFWSAEPFAAILFREPFVGSVLSPVASDDFEFTLLAPSGRPLIKGEIAEREPLVTQTLRSAELPLRLRLWPKNPAALYASLNRRQNLYLGMLATVVVLLAFGGYLTVRTLKSELTIAQMKSDFVATVSHEFRSPLAGINQLGEMLRDGRVRDESRRQEYYEMIVAETGRLRRLVENVLDFSRMEDGRKQYRFEPIEAAEWLRELTDDFRTQVAATGFAIEAEIPDRLPAIVADRETLTTAVHNLLDNAVKYSRDSNTVQLKADADAESISISVRDEGIGIRAEDQPRIFEKFYRGGGEVARQVKGVGLGLNLVQHIVDAHGGSISVQSKEGKGTTFTIRLKTARNPA